MEPRFGHDFSRVRVHTDTRAERAARAIGSDAYTIGRDIAFAAGHFNSTSYSGRSLLAHELAHVVQQRGTTGDDRNDVLSQPGDQHERAADAAAEAVVAGQPVPQQPAFGAATVARKPAGTTKAAEPRPGFLINVVVNEPVNGHEFCVRAIMQGHRIGREETEQLLATGRLHCYGWASTRGVGPDWVGHPIPFRIADNLFAEHIGSTAATAQTTPDPAEEAEVNAETNQRFWARIGDIRMLSKDAPDDAAYRELWKAERAQVLWERHDPFGPELRRFAALGNLPAAASADDIHPWELDAMLEVKTMLGQLTPRDWIRLRRIGMPQTNWQGLAEWLPKFIAQQRADERLIENVSALDTRGNVETGESNYALRHGAPSAYGGATFGGNVLGKDVSAEKLDRAGEDFRAMFRTRALEKAVETFRCVHAVMDAAANRRLPSRVENDQLYVLLQSGKAPEDLSEDVLRRYPVLRDPTTFRIARNTMYASDLGSYLARRAVKCAEDAQFLAEHIAEKPEAVFNFDAIVNATLQELGLDDSLYPQILAWGKPDGSGLFNKLFHLGLFVMLFVPGLNVIAITAFAVEAAIGSYTEIRDYNEELKKWNRGERADAPSPWGVIGAGFNLGLSLLPFAHGLRGAKGVAGAEGVLEQGGRMEALAVEKKALGAVESTVEGRAAAVEGETAAARTGTDIAEARVGESLTEAAGAGGGKVPAPLTEPVREPVKGGHHVQVSERGIEVCSPDPCPLLRVEYAEELRANSELAQRLRDIDDLRVTEPARAAAQGAELRESLQYIRAHAELFASLPSQVTPELRTRVAQLLDSAEDAGFRLNRDQAAELGARLQRTSSVAEAETVVAGLEKDLERAVFSRAEYEAAAPKGGARSTPSDPAPREATDVLRSQPGEATGGQNLPNSGRNWFPRPAPGSPYAGRPQDPRIAQIPEQIARRLRAIGSFKNFADFRSTFWRLVAEDPGLSQGWSPQNLALMRRGRAPVAAPGEWVGGGANRVYQLDHKLSLQYGGGLYDLDNIQILSPGFHGGVGE